MHRLALLGRRQVVWRFICAGLGYGHCRVWESPWISLLPPFLLLPYPFLFLFWQVSCSYFWLEEGGGHIVAEQFRKRQSSKKRVWYSEKRLLSGIVPKDLFSSHIKHSAFWSDGFVCRWEYIHIIEHKGSNQSLDSIHFSVALSRE